MFCRLKICGLTSLWSFANKLNSPTHFGLDRSGTVPAGQRHSYDPIRFTHFSHLLFLLSRHSLISAGDKATVT